VEDGAFEETVEGRLLKRRSGISGPRHASLAGLALDDEMGITVSYADLSDTTSFFAGQYDATSVVITIACALAIYNALELLLLIVTTFRRFSGLYFWSLAVASFGVIPYTIGFMIEYFKLTEQLAGLIITCVGWPMMVTGQSLVLYSRLHVVLGKANVNLLKAVKWMIIIDAIVFHASTEVVVFGTYYSPEHLVFAAAYRYLEKIQMTVFTLQEFILSGLYVWKTLEIIRLTQRRRTSRIMWQLFSINILIVVMDIALLVVEYQDRHVIEQAIKQVIYSIKLKLEFAILSKLVGLTKDNQTGFTAAFEDYDGFVNDEPNPLVRDRTKSIHTLDSSQPLAHARQPSSLDLEKPKVAYLDRFDFGSTDLYRLPSADERPTRHSHLSISTSDEQRRRRTIDDDLYASAMRDVNG